MCLSDAFEVSGGERRPLMNYVSGISVDGEKVVLTDMLGANRMHFYTILTKPLVSRDLNCTKVNRVFEQMVFRVLERQGKIKRGEYDDKIL